MKKYSFIPLLLCASTLALAGCNLGGSSGKKSSKKKSSSTETSQVSGSSQAGGSSATSTSQGGGGGGGATSTSQGGGGNTSTSGGGETTYTVDQVVSMINSAFSSVIGGDNLLEYNSTYNYYTGGLNFSEDGEDYSNPQAAESVLKPVVDTLVSYIPTAFGSYSYHYWTSAEDYWEDESGDTVSQAAYESVPGGACSVEVIGYCYNGNLLGVVSVFPAS